MAYPICRVVRPSIALRRPLVFFATWGVTFRSRRSATQPWVSYPLVRRQGARLEASFARLVHQIWHGVSFSGAGRLAQLKVHHEAVAVLHQRVTCVRQTGFFAFAFPGHARLGISRALVRLIRAPLTAEVDGRIARIVGWLVRRRLVLGSEALHAGRSLDQRPVNGE